MQEIVKNMHEIAEKKEMYYAGNIQQKGTRRKKLYYAGNSQQKGTIKDHAEKKCTMQEIVSRRGQ